MRHAGTVEDCQREFPDRGGDGDEEVDSRGRGPARQGYRCTVQGVGIDWRTIGINTRRVLIVAVRDAV
jgi:hypothetical protein